MKRNGFSGYADDCVNHGAVGDGRRAWRIGRRRKTPIGTASNGVDDDGYGAGCGDRNRETRRTKRIAGFVENLTLWTVVRRGSDEIYVHWRRTMCRDPMGSGYYTNVGGRNRRLRRRQRLGREKRGVSWWAIASEILKTNDAVSRGVVVGNTASRGPGVCKRRWRRL